ncbi:hypothetical protein Bca4012_042654 [Brassica carinata]
MAEGCLLDPQRLIRRSFVGLQIKKQAVKQAGEDEFTRKVQVEKNKKKKRHVMLDAKCDHREKTKKTNDMYTNTVATADANINIARSHELYGMMMFLTIIHTEYAAFVFIL